DLTSRVGCGGGGAVVVAAAACLDDETDVQHFAFGLGASILDTERNVALSVGSEGVAGRLAVDGVGAFLEPVVDGGLRQPGTRGGGFDELACTDGVADAFGDG